MFDNSPRILILPPFLRSSHGGDVEFPSLEGHNNPQGNRDNNNNKWS